MEGCVLLLRDRWHHCSHAELVIRVRVHAVVPLGLISHPFPLELLHHAQVSLSSSIVLGAASDCEKVCLCVESLVRHESHSRSYTTRFALHVRGGLHHTG